MKNPRILILLLALFLQSITMYSQQQKDTLSVLFVGNSYTYFENLTQIVSMMSDSLDTKLITKKSTIGGAKLRQHWLGLRGLKTKEMIKEGNFDIVVFQDHSMSTINQPDSIRKYAKLFINYAKEHNAKPYLYQTWAREKIPQYQETITKVYGEIANENNATLVSVGEAWKLTNRLRPDLNLYHTDGSHPSRLGTFLTACMFVKSILGELPTNIANSYASIDFVGEFVYLMRMESMDIEFFRRIADTISN